MNNIHKLSKLFNPAQIPREWRDFVRPFKIQRVPPGVDLVGRLAAAQTNAGISLARKIILLPRKMISEGSKMNFLGSGAVSLGRKTLSLAGKTTFLGSKTDFLGRKTVFLGTESISLVCSLAVVAGKRADQSSVDTLGVSLSQKVAFG